jgi:hypothetical protein
MKKNVYIEHSIKPSKRFGHITKLTFPDKSAIYITKKGITLTTPPKSKKEQERIIKWLKKTKRTEIIMTWDELILTLKETVQWLNRSGKK